MARLGLPACSWSFPDPVESGPDDLVAVGGDLEPQTLVTAYASGLFPMPLPRRRLGWFSPVRRGILPIDGLRVSRSLRRSVRRYEVRVDTAFERVIDACATVPRPHGWIDDAIRAAYCRLHGAGLAHSVEAWADDRLVGGLYGVALGGLFAGESMFHLAPDASKVALVALVERLADVADALLDVQWCTPHLAGLGVTEVDRRRYLELLGRAIEAPDPWVRAG